MQEKNFQSLRYGTITPTDIDAFIDFGNIVFVVIELKLKGVDVPFGQKLAIERLVDNSRKPMVGIIAEHETRSEEKIDIADCLVKEYRWKGSWKEKQATVKELIDIVLKFFKLEYAEEDFVWTDKDNEEIENTN